MADLLGVADEGIVIAVVIGVLLCALLGGIYLVWQAPMILSEAMFQLVVAGVLIRAGRRDEPGWATSVLGSTWAPFALLLLVTFLGAALLESMAPEATRISDVIAALHATQ